jgi:hypothetical protein
LQDLLRQGLSPDQAFARMQQASLPGRGLTSGGGQDRSRPSHEVLSNAAAGPSRPAQATLRDLDRPVPASLPSSTATPLVPSDRASQEFIEALQMHLVQLLSFGRKAVGSSASLGSLQVRSIPGTPLLGEKPADCVPCNSIRSTSTHLSPLDQDLLWRTHFGLQHWARCQVVLVSDDGHRSTFSLLSHAALAARPSANPAVCAQPGPLQHARSSPPNELRTASGPARSAHPRSAPTLGRS